MTARTVHQLAEVTPDLIRARCGLATVTTGARMPADHSGATGNVTCPACLNPPSWHAAGLPSKYPPR